MKFTIHDIPWKIKEVCSNDSMLLTNAVKNKGATHFFHQLIVMDSTLNKSEKYKTLCHELSHAILYETQISDSDEFNEEDLCEFIAKYAEVIVNIANDYFKQKGYR